MQFSCDGRPVALASRTAQLVTSALPAGGHFIEAAYTPPRGIVV